MQIRKPVKILDIPVHPLTMAETVNALDECITSSRKVFVVTANAEIIMMCQKDTEYNKIICCDADIVLPDGAGAVWAGRHLGYDIPERVAGFDLFNNLLNLSAKKGYKSYFFGGAQDVAEMAGKKASVLYPGVIIAGYRNGFFGEVESDTIIKDINNSGADILFVALGAPKQEKWLASHLTELNPKILMGIGGSFDVFAGKMERAPKWMQDASLEWAFRLYKQPGRWVRMLALPKFVFKVLRRGK
ncbi:MAG: WecB/TagA/CpsF family glycosyltransferase [Phascolarctobacterium sp.]|nr:WecB/TagA/CpsF family glycosyltransferase [Phascolarctobacterium sp.]